MKINNYRISGMNPYKRQFDKIEHLQRTTMKSADKVEISSAAKELQESMQLENVRQEKIQALKAQIQNGTYKIDHDKVAEGILKFFS